MEQRNIVDHEFYEDIDKFNICHFKEKELNI